MNEMAAELGLDAFAVRRVNLLPTIPYTTAYAQKVLSYGLPECLDKVMEASGWVARRGKMPKGRGLGIACSHFVSGTSTPNTGPANRMRWSICGSISTAASPS